MSNKLINETLKLLGEATKETTLNESIAAQRVERVAIALERFIKNDFGAAIVNAKRDIAKSSDPQNDRIGLNYNLEDLEAILDNFKSEIQKAYKTLDL